MSKYIKHLKEKYKETKKSSLLVYFILRALILLCMVLQIIHGDWNNAALCLLSLLLFTLPIFIEYKLKITLPSVLESIIYIFIFSAEILGEINNFYGIIPHWDTILHTINGFLAAGIGINLSPIFVAIVAFCFSMTIGVLWEFFEYSADTYLRTDMQKDRIVTSISTVELDPNNSNTPVRLDNIESTQINTKDGQIIINGGYLDIGIIDTMKDLIVNFIGAVTFSFIGYLYIRNRDKYKFASNFIPVKND